MKRIILLLAFLFLAGKLPAQTSLPSSGTISIGQIKTVMYNIGEISYFQLNSNISLESLNIHSHLSDKSAPYSLSDWYNYSGMQAAQVYYVMDGYGGITFYVIELNGDPYYVAEDLTIYFDFFTNSGWFSSYVTIYSGNNSAYWNVGTEIISMQPRSVQISALSIPNDGYRRFIFYNIT